MQVPAVETASVPTARNADKSSRSVRDSMAPFSAAQVARPALSGILHVAVYVPIPPHEDLRRHAFELGMPNRNAAATVIANHVGDRGRLDRPQLPHEGAQAVSELL